MEGKRVLIVDDDDEVADLLREVLEAERYEVHTAGSAKQAIELVRNILFDAAILDFALPDMNGLALHGRIRAMDGELADRTVFISGVAEPEDALSLSRASTFFSKPLKLPALCAKIRELIAEK